VAIQVAFIITGSALAASSRDLVAKGNSEYGKGNYDEALAAYDKASLEAPESPKLYFNKGAAHYMKGDYVKAGEMFEQAALKAKNLSLEARSQYNLGNCAFRESERQRDSDLQKSLKALEKCISHYQKAVRLDPTLKDAAHNIEIARLTMKQILDEIKKQQEQAEKQMEEMKKALGESDGQGGDSPEQKEEGEQEKQNEGQKNRAGQESKQGQQEAEKQQQTAVQRDERVHDILDEERENRERRQLGAGGGYRAVDKDW